MPDDKSTCRPSHDGSFPDTRYEENELSGFEADALERLIAGTISAETIVGDGKFAKLAFGSLRDRVYPQSALAEIDADVAERSDID